MISLEAGQGSSPNNSMIFSGRTPKSLVQIWKMQYIFYKIKPTKIFVTLHFLAVGRERMEFRESIILQTIDPIETTISSIEKKIEELEQLPSTKVSSLAYEQPKLAFCFSGMDLNGLGWGEFYTKGILYLEELTMRLVRQSQIFQKLTQKELAADEKSSKISKNYIAQPANFVLQHSLVKLLQDFGIEPHVCIGHSVGEINAALAADTLSLGQAAELVFIAAAFSKS